MKKKQWYKLDNIGNYYSVTNNGSRQVVFRYSATLSENIDEHVLDQALEESIKYYPNFNCHLKRGLFWYYLEKADKRVKVSRENKKICENLYRDDDDILYRVSYYHNRINLEVSHIISDGRGSISFFKCLLYKYLIIKYHLKDIEIENNSSFHEKIEDSYKKNYTKPKFRKLKKKTIYHLDEKKKKDNTFIEYHLSTSKVLDLAHSYNVNLTALIIGVLIEAFHKQMSEKDKNKTIKIDVPVDLRKLFNSNTSRNFFGLSSVIYRYGDNDTLEDVLKSISKQLQINTTKEELKIRMNQMIYLEKNIISRAVPIFIKEKALKIISNMNTSRCTSSVSNVGNITIEPKLEKYVKNFNALITADEMKLVIISYKDDLSIGISNRFLSNEVIKEFCNFFKNNGIEGTININQEEDDEEV